jgi:copper(I)-binding protein
VITFSRSARAVAAVTLAAGLVGLSACSAGKITQTSTEVAAVPGASVDLPPLALRDLSIVYNNINGYAKGAAAPLIVRIFNNALVPVNLVSATSDRATEVVVMTGATPPAPVATTPPGSTLTPGTSSSAREGSTTTPSGAATISMTATTTTPAARPAGQGSFPIVIPAGGYVLLVPGQGTYLQLQGLTEALPPGVSVNLTLTFDKGLSTTIPVPFGVPTEAGPRETAGHAE